MKRIWKAAIVMLTVATAFAVATGAFAKASRQQQQYAECVRMFGGGTRTGQINCCREAGGTWIEIYDSKGNIIEEGCTANNGNDLEDGSLIDSNPTIDRDRVVSGAVVAIAPTPTPEVAGDDAGTASIASESQPADSSSVEEGSSEPAPTPEAPAKVKRHRHRHHKRH